eukprot:scpid40552/ scgid30921/ 
MIHISRHHGNMVTYIIILQSLPWGCKFTTPVNYKLQCCKFTTPDLCYTIVAVAVHCIRVAFCGSSDGRRRMALKPRYTEEAMMMLLLLVGMLHTTGVASYPTPSICHCPASTITILPPAVRDLHSFTRSGNAVA